MELTYDQIEGMLVFAELQDDIETAEHWQMILDKMDEAGADVWTC